MEYIVFLVVLLGVGLWHENGTNAELEKTIDGTTYLITNEKVYKSLFYLKIFKL